jgi:hypothetical protein
VLGGVVFYLLHFLYPKLIILYLHCSTSVAQREGPIMTCSLGKDIVRKPSFDRMFEIEYFVIVGFCVGDQLPAFFTQTLDIKL